MEPQSGKRGTISDVYTCVPDCVHVRACVSLGKEAWRTMLSCDVFWLNVITADDDYCDNNLYRSQYSAAGGICCFAAEIGRATKFRIFRENCEICKNLLQTVRSRYSTVCVFTHLLCSKVRHILFSQLLSKYTVFQKSDAKIQITITTAYLMRIKYPLSGFNYHLSDVNVANFNKIHRTVSEQQLF